MENIIFNELMVRECAVDIGSCTATSEMPKEN